jgi:ribA/ribD-fused uncharacterized protein
MTVIAFTKVAKAYGWLSNMSPHPVPWDGRTWRTCEALFQARRFDASVHGEIIDGIYSATSPIAAKGVARDHVDKMCVTPQSAEDLDHMRDVLRLKIEAHSMLRAELISTGDTLIVEDVSSRPHGSALFWGAARCLDGWNGVNQLGRLWMELRTSLREHALSAPGQMALL